MQLKIATLSPEGSFWMEKMREGGAEVEKQTQGRVKIKYYPGGVMGDDKAVLRKIRIGQLQGGALVSGSLADVFPENQIYGLPLKFKSFEEVDHVRRHMDALIAEGMEKGGFVTFGLAEGGFAYIMSAQPIRTVADLRQRKIWIPDNDPAILEAVKPFDISPIPLSIADVRAGLQTGLIDTVATSPIGAVALQWHTQVNYLTDLPFLYIYAVLAIDKKAFSEISPADQPAVREIMGRVFHEIDRQNRSDNIKALEALKNQGITFVQPPPEALEEWYKRAAEVPERLLGAGRFSRKTVEMFDGYLREFRSR
ncbi:MAG: TRAP transporter substrate-binding protein DctP [Desulfobacterales bacterium]